jgi:hypothetical protein
MDPEIYNSDDDALGYIPTNMMNPKVKGTTKTGHERASSAGAASNMNEVVGLPRGDVEVRTDVATVQSEDVAALQREGEAVLREEDVEVPRGEIAAEQIAETDIIVSEVERVSSIH